MLAVAGRGPARASVDVVVAACLAVGMVVS